MQNASDAQAQLDQITAELERDRAQLAAVGQRAQRPVTGADDSGMIEVGLDRYGRLTRVRLDNAWERELGAEGLGPAVMVAYRAAAASRAEVWAHGFDADASPETTDRVDGSQVAEEDVDESLMAPAPLQPDEAGDRAIADNMTLPRQVTEALANRGPDSSDEALVAGLMSYLEDAERAFDTALGEIDALSSATVTGTSSSGRIAAVVTLSGGEPQSLTIDSSWVVGAHPFNISREVVEAVNDAQRSAALRAAEQTGADDLRKLQDPRELLERLRIV